VAILLAGQAALGSSVPGVGVGHPVSTDTSPAAYCGQNPFFNSGSGGQCTAFCWGRTKEKLGISLPFTGNAQTWWSTAQGLYQTGSVAEPNSIAVWSYGVYGHVAFVEEVDGNQVLFNEANWHPSNLDWGYGYSGALSPSNVDNPGPKILLKSNMVNRGNYHLLGYIYLPTYTVLHNFTGGSGGASPFGSLTLSGSTLYGMTSGFLSSNLGKVFKINNDGTGYTILHSFTGGSDGAWPYDSLTLSGSTLYGMTSNNWSSGLGTVFKINSDGTGYTILHNFTGGSDGDWPFGSLTLSGSILYGMTVGSSMNGDFGMVFKINNDGSGYTILHNFTGGSDGACPWGSLTLSGSTLYGMTSNNWSSDFGTVFKINSDGTGYTILHNFTGGSDGDWPFGSLTLSGSILYGMTVGSSMSSDFGTVFKINSDGTGYTILHNFTGGSDGACPWGSLMLSGSTLYGMTSGGGSSNFGTVFKINSNGTGYTILHNFTGGSDDGNSPEGSLTLSGSTLYGMTSGGGSSNAGTVFKIDHAALVPSTITIATPTNPNVGQRPTGLSGQLNYWDVTQNPNRWVPMTAVPSTSIFDPSRPTIVIAHGWCGSISNTPDSGGSDNWTMRMAKQAERIANQNVNVLAWDWHEAANPAGVSWLTPFVQDFFTNVQMINDAAESARNGNVEGGKLAVELKLIGINPTQTQLIGFSNGGAVMIAAANTLHALTGQKIQRLTTLDSPNITPLGVPVNATKYINPSMAQEIEVYYSSDRLDFGFGARVSGSNVFNGEVYPTGNPPSPEHLLVPDWYTNLGETATIPHAPNPNVRGMNWSIISPNCPSTWFAEDCKELVANTGIFNSMYVGVELRAAKPTTLKQMNFSSGEEYQGTHAATVTDPVRSYVANLWGNSDGYLFKTITIPADAIVMTFDMKVVTVVSGDYITLSFGDKVLFCEDITDVDSNFVTTLPIPIPDLAGQTDTLLFTLHHDTDTPGSSVLLDNITFSTTLMAVDLNMDGKVDFTDYAIFANHWMYQNCAEPDWCEGTDFDHSGQVDIFDLVEFAKNWLSGS
jgi:uncharacterized repeat protein (TIGR03803 family)